ncbi:MAG: patatin-like phospholipase family protein [Terriglobia bacterium]
MLDDDLEKFYRVLAERAAQAAHNQKSKVASELHKILRAQWKDYPAKHHESLEAYFSSTKRAPAPAPGSGGPAQESPIPARSPAPQKSPAPHDDSPTPRKHVLEEDPALAERIANLFEVPPPFAFVKLREEAEIKELRQLKGSQEFAGNVLAVLEASNGTAISLKKGEELHDLLKKTWKDYPAQGSTYEELRKEFLALKDKIFTRLIEDLPHKFDAKTYDLIKKKIVNVTSISDDLYTGLAFSGGGIRSATFNLGILQGLAKAGLLPAFDYLSTVSGGGYIGSWLVAWLKRQGFADVNRQLSPDWNQHGQEEPPQIEFIRSYSNYLTPRLGLLSADSWSLLAIWVRNLLLNLTILILAISAVLLLPRLVVSLSQGNYPYIYMALTVVLIAFALFWTGANLKLLARHQMKYPWYSTQGTIQWTIAIPTLLASWFLSCWLWNRGCPPQWPWWMWALTGAVITFLIWFAAWLVSLSKDPKRSPDDQRPNNISWLPLVAFAPVAGAVGGLLLDAIAKLFAFWSYHHYPGSDIHFVAWGTGLVAAVFGLMVVIHIGFMGKGFPDERREWWGRAGGLIAIYTLGWVAVFGFALYSPLVVQWAGRWASGAVTLGWLAHTITGVWGAWSAKTSGSKSSDDTGLLIKAAPAVFVVGLLALLSYGIYRTLPHLNLPLAKPFATCVSVSSADHQQDKSTAASTPAKGRTSFHDQALAYWPSVLKAPSIFSVSALILFCGLLALLLSWRVDINEFSMHLLYRNRLVRCYLGASHQAERSEPEAVEKEREAEPARNANPFTGFDPADDMLLANLAQRATHPKEGGKDAGPYVGPYPILNTTLDVTHGKRLAWQERKAESFSFTPLYCGFKVGPDRQPLVAGRKKPLEPNGYRPTRDYIYSEKHSPGGPYLGTALGISGAAASPNMGYHSSSPLAFLMTVFDVRLGWWAGNPRSKRSRGSLSQRVAPPWMRRGPRLGILYLLRELFGLSDDESGYVYLSDGGHFENLGIYELVRRECRLIVACDAGADKDYHFEDLGNAIRKCRIDFGVDISIPVAPLQPIEDKDAGTKWSPRQFAVGIIHYEKLDAGKKPGLLVYLKTSLTGAEPTDILEYRNQDNAFPNDSTANQFFTESQFESYRKLGEYIMAEYIAVETDGFKFVSEPTKWQGLNPSELEEEVKRFNVLPKKKV